MEDIFMISILEVLKILLYIADKVLSIVSGIETVSNKYVNIRLHFITSNNLNIKLSAEKS